MKQLWCIDFDGGASACKSAYYRNNNNIRCWEPWVMQTKDRTAYDYPATHDRVMDILRFALTEHENLWGVMITGVDLWDNVCINNMKITDMGIAKDGIEASDPSKTVGNQWNWSMRSTRFHQLTSMCRGLVKRGVAVFLETHLKKTNYSHGSSEQGAPWRPAWEKSTNNLLFQIVMFERTDIEDEEGEPLMSEYTATFEKSKTDSTLQGQKINILKTEQGMTPVWYGLPELDRL